MNPTERDIEKTEKIIRKLLNSDWNDKEKIIASTLAQERKETLELPEIKDFVYAADTMFAHYFARIQATAHILELDRGENDRIEKYKKALSAFQKLKESLK